MRSQMMTTIYKYSEKKSQLKLFGLTKSQTLAPLLETSIDVVDNYISLCEEKSWTIAQWHRNWCQICQVWFDIWSKLGPTRFSLCPIVLHCLKIGDKTFDRTVITTNRHFLPVFIIDWFMDVRKCQESPKSSHLSEWTKIDWCQDSPRNQMIERFVRLILRMFSTSIGAVSLRSAKKLLKKSSQPSEPVD